jgi:hypothetical protein
MKKREETKMILKVKQDLSRRLESRNLVNEINKSLTGQGEPELGKIHLRKKRK